MIWTVYHKVSDFLAVNMFKIRTRWFKQKYCYSFLTKGVSRNSESKCHFIVKKSLMQRMLVCYMVPLFTMSIHKKSISLNTVGDSLFAHSAQLPSSWQWIKKPFFVSSHPSLRAFTYCLLCLTSSFSSVQWSGVIIASFSWWDRQIQAHMHLCNQCYLCSDWKLVQFQQFCSMKKIHCSFYLWRTAVHLLVTKRFKLAHSDISASHHKLLRLIKELLNHIPEL